MDPIQFAELASQIAAVKTQLASMNGSYWPALITGAFTLAAALLGGQSIEASRHRRQAVSVRTALIAEVKALAQIAKSRNYLRDLADGEKSPSPLEVPVPENYNPVYRANAQNIGLLSAKDAQLIVTFHQYVQSVLQDVGPGGALSSDWATSDGFKEARLMLKEAINIADQL